MTHLKIDHLGIAVPSLDQATAAWEALGFRVEATHDVPTEKVRVAFLPVGDGRWPFSCTFLGSRSSPS